jgi:ribosome biogenesis GTPase A
MNFRNVLEKCNIVLEVLDARDVHGTRSREMENLAMEGGKKLILVINKTDLAPEEEAERAKSELSKEGSPVVLLSAKKHRGTRRLRETILRNTGNKLEVLVGVVGYANVGKSSVISALKGKTAAKISPKPGFTKGVQIVKISKRMKLLDTPGLIPRGEDRTRLALIGSYDPARLKDPIGTALKVVESDFYEGLPEDPYEALEFLAKKWNMLLKKGEPDVNRAARKVLEEWQRRGSTS